MIEYIVLVVLVIIVFFIAVAGRKQNNLQYAEGAALYNGANGRLPGLGAALPNAAGANLVGGSRKRQNNPWFEENGAGMN
jgi:hypothetical protein